MSTLDLGGRAVELNELGFLARTEDWDEEVALLLAQHQEGLTALGKDHWAVIRYIRGFYLEHGLAPLIRKICRTTGLNLKYIYTLFPSGPAKGACKVAGLPTPEGCV